MNTSQKLTMYIEHQPNGSIHIQGQKDELGYRRGVWEYFDKKNKLKLRLFYDENGDLDGYQYDYNECGDIVGSRLYSHGNLLFESLEGQPKRLKPEQIALLKAFTRWLNDKIRSEDELDELINAFNQGERGI
jgi:hypothetical protein